MKEPEFVSFVRAHGHAPGPLVSARNLKEELMGKRLTLRQWSPHRDEKHDHHGHDHCEICFKEISDKAHAEHEGYTDATKDFWVCKGCFEQHQDILTSQ